MPLVVVIGRISATLGRMFRSSAAVLVFSALALSCCKSEHSKLEGATTGKATATAAADQAPPPPSQTAKEASGGGSGDSPHEQVWPADLPRLQPVLDKPFPEGATEEQVCEAIENKEEKDLWVRFGHLVPTYIYASILVLDGTKEDIPKIESLMYDYQKGKYHPSIKACPEGGLPAQRR